MDTSPIFDPFHRRRQSAILSWPCTETSDRSGTLSSPALVQVRECTGSDPYLLSHWSFPPSETSESASIKTAPLTPIGSTTGIATAKSYPCTSNSLYGYGTSNLLSPQEGSRIPKQHPEPPPPSASAEDGLWANSRTLRWWSLTQWVEWAVDSQPEEQQGWLEGRRETSTFSPSGPFPSRGFCREWGT